MLSNMEKWLSGQQNLKKRNWPLIAFISIIVGIILIALIAWSILYSKGEVGLIGTYSSINIYCKDCTGESKQQCQTVCENEFVKVNAPLISASMNIQKLGDRNLVTCSCEGRAEDFKKLLSGIETNWDELLKIASEEGGKLQENLKQEQIEKRANEPLGFVCNDYYDQPYNGMRSLPEFLQYQYPYCVLKTLYDYGEKGVGEKHLPLCDKKYVFTNSNDICKYMIAYYLKDISMCESASFSLSGSKEECMDILNKCPSNSRSCIMNLALINGNYESCSNIPYRDNIDTFGNRNRLDCIGKSNTFTGSKEACTALEKELTAYNQNYQANLNSDYDYCWMNVARVKKDASFCDNVNPGKNSRDCHTLVAVAKQDINICNLIKEDEISASYPNASRTICYDNYKKIIIKK